MINVRDALRRSAQWNSDALAIISDDRGLTFGEAWDRGIRLANGLLSLGLEPGDRVAVLEDNSVEASDFFLATAIANLVRVPLYKRNAPDAHAHMVGHTGCRAVVVTEAYADELGQIKDAAPSVKHVLTRGRDYESWLAKQSNVDPNVPVSLDDFYVIRHSGGTTGRSKGMAFTHRAWMNTERDWTYRLPPIERGDACVHVGPISHGSGYLFVPIWISGGYNILESKFEAVRVLDLLEEHGGYMFAVPTMLSDIIALKDQRKRKFSGLKAVAIAGAPVRPQTALAAHEMFGDRLHQFYGQTEAVPVAWMTGREWFDKTMGEDALLSVGRIVPFAEVEIRDEENRPVAEGEEGEVAVKVDGQMIKIWNEPEMTAQRMVDGWVLTGDVGRIDARGYLHLVDRKDDMIISGGFNIWPAELEIAISTLPQVREVAVVAAPHERWGETPVAVVVLHQDATLTEQQVIDVCFQQLGAYKRPSKVVFREEPLPRTPVGKVPRKSIRQLFWTNGDSRIGGA